MEFSGEADSEAAVIDKQYGNYIELVFLLTKGLARHVGRTWLATLELR